MEQIKIYREAYQFLPKRFLEKLEADLDYLSQAGLPGLRRVYLFGSCARGEVRSSSDIDLLVYTDRKLENRMLASEVRWTLDEPRQGVRTDVVYKNDAAAAPDSVFERTATRDRILVMEVLE